MRSQTHLGTFCCAFGLLAACVGVAASTGARADSAVVHNPRARYAELHEARRLLAVGDVAAALERLAGLNLPEVPCVRGEAFLRRGRDNNDGDSSLRALESYARCLEESRRGGNVHLAATAAFGVLRSHLQLGDDEACRLAIDEFTELEEAQLPPNTLESFRQALDLRLSRQTTKQTGVRTDSNSQI